MNISRLNLPDLADTIRDQLKYSSDCPIDFSDLTTRMPNLTVVYRPFSDDTSGMCIKYGKEKGIIAINSKMAIGRRHFTLAHELYHFYFSEASYVVCIGDEDNGKIEEERKANEFAMFFLMPNRSVFGFFKNECASQMDINAILKMEHYFQVSRRAILTKLGYLKLLDPKGKENYLNGIVRIASEKGYPKELYTAPNIPEKITYGKFVAIVGDMFDRGFISKQKRDELLLDAYRDDIVFPKQEGE